MGEQDVDTGGEAIKQERYERFLDQNEPLENQWTREELDEYMGRTKEKKDEKA